MVRLKDKKYKGAFFSVSWFQFLMVRLKEAMNEFKNIHSFISIPYGAIKSALIAKWPIAFLDISIPYGAIKSLIEEF